MIQGRYLIVQPIGKGGMGEVYLAVDQRLGSAVALKRTFFSDDSTLGTAFEREARILARLRHPVLPKVIDHFSENGDQYLVMEHISGDDIAKRIESANKPFPVSWVMFWSDQMLDALAYLHSHEPPIVHRDIKPQNLKLTDDNHIVLLDFGLSKDFDSNSGGLNSASVAGYSPHFASMEQIRGTGTDARSDIYSLAATLYQMLTNVIPVDALTRADAILGGKGDPIRHLNELNPEVTPAISDVILKAISIRQDERYSTALEMQKALRRAFNAEKSDLTTKPSADTGVVSPNAPTKPTSNPKVSTAPVVKESAETPEMETQIRVAAPIPLDATLQMPSMADQAKQSEQKTAVLQSEEVAASIPAAVEQPVQKAPEPPPAQPQKAAAAAAGLSSQAASMPKAPAAVPAQKPQAAPKKSSKTGLIVGLLLAFFLIAGVGGGAGWWMLNRSSGGTASGTPTPQPANVSTPAPTPESPVLTDTNTAGDTNANAEVGSGMTPSGSNSNVAVTTPPANSRSTSSTTTPPRPTTPKPPTTATDKDKPKAKPKDDRTVILQ